MKMSKTTMRMSREGVKKERKKMRTILISAGTTQMKMRCRDSITETLWKGLRYHTLIHIVIR